MRFVFDASTIVGAALRQDGTPMRALIAARAAGTLALSTAVHAEIAEVLGRPKFAAVLPRERREELLEILAAGAIWSEPDIGVTDCADPADNKYLELALAAGAAFLVSSDRHLLVMHPWRGVSIVSAAELVAQLGRGVR